MLTFEAPIDADGITVYRDDTDANRYWYLPGPVVLSRHHDREAFSFITYRSEEKSGGYLMMQVSLNCGNPDDLARIRAKVGSGNAIEIAPVPFDSGKVQCMALNLQGPGGTAASTPAAPVEKILGASEPSLQGANTAVFSLVLDPNGVAALKEALEGGMRTVGILYNLTFSGMRPALDVAITAHLKDIAKRLKAGVRGGYDCVMADINVAFEEMKRDKTIDIRIRNCSNDTDRKQKEDAALQLFKDLFLDDFATPALQFNAPDPADAKPPAARAADIAAAAPSAAKPVAEAPAAKSGPPEPSSAKPAAPAAAGGKSGPPEPSSGKAAPAPAPASSSPAPAGAKAAPSVTPGGAPRKDTAAAPSEGLTFKLDYQRLEHSEDIHFDFRSTEVMKRSYNPQNLVASLTRHLSRDDPRYFSEVNPDEFFTRQEITVRVAEPDCFVQCAIDSIRVTLIKPGTGHAPEQRNEFLFTAGEHADKVFKCWRNKSDPYSYEVEYTFAPSEWAAPAFVYTFKGVSEQKSLSICHWLDFEFLTLTVTTGLDDSVDGADLHLRCESAGEDIAVVVELQPPWTQRKTCKVRLRKPWSGKYTYTLELQLRNGDTWSTPERCTAERKLTLHAPGRR